MRPSDAPNPAYDPPHLPLLGVDRLRAADFLRAGVRDLARDAALRSERTVAPPLHVPLVRPARLDQPALADDRRAQQENRPEDRLRLLLEPPLGGGHRR